MNEGFIGPKRRTHVYTYKAFMSMIGRPNGGFCAFVPPLCIAVDEVPKPSHGVKKGTKCAGKEGKSGFKGKVRKKKKKKMKKRKRSVYANSH